MPVTITAFANSPDRGRGLARDLRIRWALEEVGQPYDVRLLSFAEMNQDDHLALSPFGQIPTLQDGAVTLFETGAILLHIAQRQPGLLPADAAAKARAISWMFAAIGTLQPPIVDRSMLILFERDQPWHDAHLATVEARIAERLAQLSAHLGASEWLDGPFSAGDLMVADTLRRLGPGPLLDAHDNLAAYRARAEARPAFRRAFAAQYAVFVAARGE